MLAVSAEANTSAGAPSVICCTSAEEASKLNVAFASGLAAVNASPTSVNDSVSDAAANTVMSPSTPAAAVVAGASVVSAAAVVGRRGRLRRRSGRRCRRCRAGRRRCRTLVVVIAAACSGNERQERPPGRGTGDRSWSWSDRL